MCKSLAYLHKCTPRYNYISVAQHRSKRLNNIQNNSRLSFLPLIRSNLHVFPENFFLWSLATPICVAHSHLSIVRTAIPWQANFFIDKTKTAEKTLTAKANTCFLLQNNHHLVILWDLPPFVRQNLPQRSCHWKAYGATHGFETISFQLHFMAPLKMHMPICMQCIIISETNKWLPFRTASLNWRTCNYSESTLTKFGVSVP